MAISSRQGLIDYCLRRLGYPVIEINVDDDQIEDRIDDAFQHWNEYHFDGVERSYIKRELTGSALTISTAATFTEGERVTGGTTNAIAIVHKSSAGTSVVYEKPINATEFAVGEDITGFDSGATGTITAIVKGDIENGYIPIGNEVLNVTKLFKFGGVYGRGGGKSDGLFDVDYQFALNDMYNLLSADVTYYAQVKTHMNLLENLFTNERPIRFNRKTNRVYIDTDMDRTFNIGNWVIAEGYAIIDATTFTEVYDDMFLKRYATALIKRQWGENMKKFGGIALPGGVTLNGDQIYSEAIQEVATIEDEMQLKYELPPMMIAG
jgi:hypothetical protein